MGCSSRAIVFIAGPPKCGTTWMMETLDSHPNGAIADEAHVGSDLLWHMTRVMGHYRTHRPRVKLSRSGPRGEVFSDQDFMDTLRFISDRFFLRLEQLAAERGQDPEQLRIIGDKSPGHTRHVHLLSGVFPEAKFIVCVRDVRDAAVSAYMHFVRSGAAPDFFGPAKDLAGAAEVFARHHWAEMLRFARAAGERIGPERYLEIDYQDHKAAPEATLRCIFDFLGVEASDEEVGALISANSFEAKSHGRKPGEESNEHVRKGIVGDWQNHFTPEFGDYLLGVAQQRLSLGERVVDNVPQIRWQGRALVPQPV